VGARGSHAGAYRGHLIDRPNLGTALDREAVTTSVPTSDRHRRTSLSSSSAGCRSAGSTLTASSTRDGLDYLAIRDHLYQVGRSVLARLSNLDDMADDERREYFRDAHGLLASMTHSSIASASTRRSNSDSPTASGADERERPERRGLVPREHGTETVALRRPQWVAASRRVPAGQAQVPAADGYRPDATDRRSDGLVGGHRRRDGWAS